ncbi:MAG: ABC transporter ATP-binding protein [bacterium]|nr:ABC transporter ATP-binding protein [bacterium]
MSNILTIKNLNKKYDNFELKNINIEVKGGVIVGFIGENGAGKTTTIKSILNLINIDQGEIRIFDKDYKKYEKLIKEDIGVILDNSFMPESLSPIDINSIMKNMYKRWDEKLFFNYLDRFKLPKDKAIKDYSSGMLMKLKIITSISSKPKLLILDEPTNGLDPIARSEILDLFQEFVLDDSHSIFVSSHITKDLEQVADYIIFISNGEIILNSSKDSLLDNYALVKCSSSDFDLIDKKDIIKYKKNKYEYQVLINDKNNFLKKYNIKTIDKITLDDIMLLYIKGENNE